MFSKTVKNLPSFTRLLGVPKSLPFHSQRIQSHRQRPPLGILKFGGSSVGTADSINQVADLLIDTNKRSNIVAVISAMYGVTNRLIKVHQLAESGDDKGVKTTRDALHKFHFDTATQLFGYGSEKFKIMEQVDQMFSEIDQQTHILLNSKNNLNSSDRGRILDTISSMGERMAVPLVSAAVNKKGVIAHPISTEKIIIKKNSNLTPPTPNLKNFDKLDILLEESSKRMKDKLGPILRDQQIPILTGFLAGTINGEITTLDRGGSDLTATLSALFLNADYVDLFKVECCEREDGFMEGWKPMPEQIKWTGIRSADPNVIHSSRLVMALSYEEAKELCHFGKKVLHPMTMLPVEQKHIPIRVRNTALSQSLGTVIRDARQLSDEEEGQVKAIISLPASKYQALQQRLQFAFEQVASSVKGGMNATCIAVIGRNIALRTKHTSRVRRELQKIEGAFIPTTFNQSLHNFVVFVPKEMERQAYQCLHQELVC